MKATTETGSELPIRVGVFASMQEADAVIADLLSAGFTVDEITVVCSEKAVQRHFQQYEHQDPAGTHTPAAAIAGGAGGVALGGLAALAGAATLGGAGLLVAGGLAMWAGGVVGGLIGAMMTRGVEKELANFYDQAVTEGKILVAAEQEDPRRHAMLAKAAHIFASHGAHPLPLPEA